MLPECVLRVNKPIYGILFLELFDVNEFIDPLSLMLLILAMAVPQNERPIMISSIPDIAVFADTDC